MPPEVFLLALIALSTALLSDAHPTARELLSTVTVAGVCETDCPPGNMALGAGEIIDRRPDGTLVVLTARHVIENASPSVYVRNGAEPGIGFDSFVRVRYARQATVLAYASNVDLALVAFRPEDEDEYAFAPLGGTNTSTSENAGVVIGDPNGSLWTVSSYTILEQGGGTFSLECATCGPGDSGGGVFDAGGRLLGILVQQRVDGQDDRPGARTTEFQAVSLAELKMFLEAAKAPASGGSAAEQSKAWIRFNAMRRT